MKINKPLYTNTVVTQHVQECITHPLYKKWALLKCANVKKQLSNRLREPLNIVGHVRYSVLTTMYDTDS